MDRSRTLSDDENANDDQVIGVQRHPPIFHDRINYVELYDNEHDFINMFHVSKATFTTILRSIENKISPPSALRTREILAPCKLYIMLRYFATDSLRSSVADFPDVSESLACHYVLQACRAVARLRPNFVSFPTNDIGAKRVTDGFYSRGKFLGVIGALGCTHIKIQSPDRENAETFRNKNGYFSIKTQCVCNPWLKIMDIVGAMAGFMP